MLQLSTFYGFSFRFCNIYSGHEKGHVERSVEYIRRRAFARRDIFDTLPLAQQYLEETLNQLNDKKLAGSTSTITELMSGERDLLLVHPGNMECFLLEEARVDKYSTFSLGANHYSVPDYLVGQKVEVKVYANQLKIYYQAEVLGIHTRSYGSGQWIIALDHYLRTLERKPGALHGSAALKQAPAEIRDIYNAAFRENARDFIDLLQYCKLHDIPHVRLWEAYQVLRVKCPSDISLDKFKVLLGNNPGQVGITYADTEISRHSLEQLLEISQLLQKN
jgi:hypothetical protein